MLESPAPLGGLIRIIVNAVTRMNVADYMVHERIRLLGIVRFLQMTGKNVVVTSAGIRRRKIVKLAALRIGDRHVRALPLQPDSYQFCVRSIVVFVRINEPEVIPLGGDDGTAHFPDKVIIVIRIIRLCPPVGLPLGFTVVLFLRSCFFFLCDLRGGVDIHVHGIAVLGIRLAVAADRQDRLKIRAGIPVCRSRAVRIVVLIIVRTPVRTVTDLKITVLSGRTRKPVVNDYFVCILIDAVNKYVVRVEPAF